MKVMATGIEPPDMCARFGLEGHITPVRDLLAVETPELRSPVGSIAVGVSRLQLPVEPDVSELLPIFPDQSALPGRWIQQKDVVPARVAIVEVYRDLVGDDV